VYIAKLFNDEGAVILANGITYELFAVVTKTDDITGETFNVSHSVGIVSEEDLQAQIDDIQARLDAITACRSGQTVAQQYAAIQAKQGKVGQ
jgi:hypothetical protein